MNRPLQFTIPVVPGKTIMVQEDILPQFYPYLHRHNEAQIIGILRGEGSLFIESKIHAFKPGDVFFISPNQAHLFKSIKSSKDIHSISIFFDPDGVLNTVFALPELQNLKSFLRENDKSLKIENNCSRKAINFLINFTNIADTELFIHFIELLHLLAQTEHIPLSENINPGISEGEGLRMQRIYDYILKNFTGDITLDEIAEIGHLTPQAFCRYFKKHTGSTFITFINELRVSEAQKKMIENKYNSITELAFNSGFNSITNFNRVFKKIVGKAPKEYLSEYKKGSG